MQDTALWRLKERLQFTGWLQYLITLIWSLAFFLLAGVGSLVGAMRPLLLWLPLAIGALLLLVSLFDLVTIKLGWRPAEPRPKRRDDLDPFTLMRTRRSCRSFQARDLSPDDHAELMEYVRRQSEPASRLGDRPIRFEYVAAPLTVWPVVGGREFLVAIAPHEYDRRAIIDVGRCLQKIVLHATRMGLGTCWIGPGADHASIKQHLGERFDPNADHIVCVCAVGYASRFLPLFIRIMSKAMRRRRPLEDLFYEDPLLQTPLDTEGEPFGRFTRCYEACRWAPSSFNAQPTRAVVLTQESEGEEGSPERIRVDFLASTDSRWYAPVALGIWCANWETGCEALGIPGRFAVLEPQAHGAGDAPRLPRYDLSWVEDGEDGESGTPP